MLFTRSLVPPKLHHSKLQQRVHQTTRTMSGCSACKRYPAWWRQWLMQAALGGVDVRTHEDGSASEPNVAKCRSASHKVSHARGVMSRICEICSAIHPRYINPVLGSAARKQLSRRSRSPKQPTAAPHLPTIICASEPLCAYDVLRDPSRGLYTRVPVTPEPTAQQRQGVHGSSKFPPRGAAPRLGSQAPEESTEIRRTEEGAACVWQCTPGQPHLA